MDDPVAGEVQRMVGSPEEIPSLDFSMATPTQFGISMESFIPSSRNKEKSRLSKLKARRRSTVGVRGSPATNSLIRYIAQQKCCSSPGFSPDLQPSRFTPRGFSTLREKIASFQSLLEVDEGLKAEALPAGDWTEVSDEISAVIAKENRDPQGCFVFTPPPSSKKPRMECVQVSPPFLAYSSSPVAPVGVLTPNHAESDASRLEYTIHESPLMHSTSDLGPPIREWHAAAEAQQACPKGPELPECNDLHLLNEPAVPSLMFLSPLPKLPEYEVADASASMKKRVRFGAPLLPEFFDKTLPPSTPLQKGGTPTRLIYSVEPQLRSLLKTPQRSSPPFPQTDLSSPSLSSSTEMRFDPAGPADVDDKEPMPDVTKEISESSLKLADVVPAQIISCELQSPKMCPMPLQGPHTGTAPELEIPRASEVPVTDAAPARSRSRKRKQASKSLTVRPRASRAAAISASQKMKSSLDKKPWGSREVDRSLYGKRDYASKNPTLSPIREVVSASHSPTPWCERFGTQASGEGEGVAMEYENGSIISHGGTSFDSTASIIAAAAMWRQRFCCRTQSPVKKRPVDKSAVTLEGQDHSFGADQRGIRGTRGRARAGVGHKRQVELATETDRAVLGPPKSLLEESMQGTSDIHVEGDGPENPSPACNESDVKEECGKAEADSDTPAPPQSDESGTDEKVNTGRKGKGGRRGRRSCQVPPDTAAPHTQMHLQEVPGPSFSGTREEVRQDGNNSMEDPCRALALPTGSSEVNEGGQAWQLLNFSIEDVLQPPSKARRSVRRSLRNQANVEPSMGGLAWVPHTSPDSRSLHRGSQRWARRTLLEEPDL